MPSRKADQFTLVSKDAVDRSLSLGAIKWIN